jgi:hypothetical protein
MRIQPSADPSIIPSLGQHGFYAIERLGRPRDVRSPCLEPVVASSGE